MLDKPATPPRARLAATAVEVLQVLPAIGRLMVTANHRGATHERIGVVEAVTLRDGWAILSGTEHESRIELAAIAEIVVDRSSVMRDKVYPRLDLLRADGTAIAGIVGFEGLEPFDAAVAGLAVGEAVEPRPEKPTSRGEEATPDDAGRVRLETARQAGKEVAIGFSQPGFRQVWRGRIEEVKPAMGFINVMQSDFHLHLKAGAVADWQQEGDVFAAYSADGAPLGLTLEPAVTRG